jgi:molybdate transport system regulatory protein
MPISARNRSGGRGKTLTIGPVHAEVTLELAGGPKIVSVVTAETAHALHLTEGKAVTAVVKATNVLVGTA